MSGRACRAKHVVLVCEVCLLASPSQLAAASSRHPASPSPHPRPNKPPAIQRGTHLIRGLGCLGLLLRIRQVALRLGHPLLADAGRAAQLGQPLAPRIHLAARLRGGGDRKGLL